MAGTGLAPTGHLRVSRILRMTSAGTTPDPKRSRNRDGAKGHDQQDRPGHGRRHDRHQGRFDRADRRVRRCRPAQRADRRPDPSGRQGPDRGRQQRRRRAHRPRAADGAGPGAQDHLLFSALLRSGGIRNAVSCRQDRAGDRAAGNAGRAHACRRCRRAGVLHRHRGGDEDGSRQGTSRDRRPHLHPGTVAARRRGAGRGVGSGSLGQPDVPRVQAATSIR